METKIGWAKQSFGWPKIPVLKLNAQQASEYKGPWKNNHAITCSMRRLWWCLCTGGMEGHLHHQAAGNLVINWSPGPPQHGYRIKMPLIPRLSKQEFAHIVNIAKPFSKIFPPDFLTRYYYLFRVCLKRTVYNPVMKCLQTIQLCGASGSSKSVLAEELWASSLNWKVCPNPHHHLHSLQR